MPRPPSQPLAAPAAVDRPELPHRVKRGWRHHLMARLRGQQSRRGLEKEGLRVGRNVLIGSGAVIDPGFLWLVDIGDDSTIAPGVQIIAHDASTKHLVGSSLVE